MTGGVQRASPGFGRARRTRGDAAVRVHALRVVDVVGSHIQIRLHLVELRVPRNGDAVEVIVLQHAARIERQQRGETVHRKMAPMRRHLRLRASI